MGVPFSSHTWALLPLLPLFLMCACTYNMKYKLFVINFCLTDDCVLVIVLKKSGRRIKSSRIYQNVICWGGFNHVLKKVFKLLVKCKSGPHVVVLKLHHSVLLCLHPVYCKEGKEREKAWDSSKEVVNIWRGQKWICLSIMNGEIELKCIL